MALVPVGDKKKLSEFLSVLSYTTYRSALSHQRLFTLFEQRTESSVYPRKSLSLKSPAQIEEKSIKAIYRKIFEKFVEFRV